MDDLLADFLTETQEGLVALDAAMVRLERAPKDRGTLAEVFRVVHTIKGTCGFLGLPRLEAVAHAAENVPGRWRDGSLSVTQEGISLILRSLDAMRHVVSGLEGQGREPAGDDAVLIAALNAAAEGLAAPAAPEAAPPDADGPAAAATADGAPACAGTAPAAPEEAPGAGTLSVPQTIRVAVEVLEDLMTLVSELVLTRTPVIIRTGSRESRTKRPIFHCRGCRPKSSRRRGASPGLHRRSVIASCFGTLCKCAG